MNVLITTPSFIPSVLLCGHSQLVYLEKLGKIKYKYCTSYFLSKEDVDWADIIIFVRNDNLKEAYFAQKAKEANKKLIYVMDDDLLNVPLNLSCSPYYRLKSTKKNIKNIMSCCDTFLTPSPVLLEKYGQDFKYKYLIDEPSLNTIESKPSNPIVKIGFAGSVDRTDDINILLKDAIKELIAKYQDKISIEFMGAKPDFVKEFKLKHYPYQDGYDNYTAFMSRLNWDIGLAPMPKSEFHRCKYFNKFVEYASFGIVGVYSNLEPYTYGITNNENGLLVNNNTSDWVEAISRLIEDDKLRKELSDNCLKIAKEKYSLEKCSLDFYAKITKDFQNNCTSKVEIDDKINIKFYFEKLCQKIAIEKLLFPIWAGKYIILKIFYKVLKFINKFNAEKLQDCLNNKKTMFVIAYDTDDKSYLDDVSKINNYFKDYFKIILKYNEKIKECFKYTFTNDSCTITSNLFAINQTKEIVDLIKSCDHLLIHGVDCFVRDKMPMEIYSVLDDDINLVWATHGMIPEKHHQNNNYYSERLTSDVEQLFYEKCATIIVKDESEKEHYLQKYGNKNINFLFEKNLNK